MYVVRGRLTPEVGALLMRAIEAAGDALFRERRVPCGGDISDREAAQQPQVSGRPAPALRSAIVDSDREAAQRRSDALGLLAERALAAGFGAAQDGGTAAAEAPVSGTRAERYQVMLHVDRETLSAEGELGRSELEDGTGLSAETSRRIACDASVVAVTHEKDGSVLDVGRKTRTIPPGLRRALEVRDQGCRFPGCGLRFCDAHHLRHWADGGETSMANCLSLCKFHHTLVHERGWRVEWWGKGTAGVHGSSRCRAFRRAMETGRAGRRTGRGTRDRQRASRCRARSVDRERPLGVREGHPRARLFRRARDAVTDKNTFGELGKRDESNAPATPRPSSSSRLNGVRRSRRPRRGAATTSRTAANPTQGCQRA